MSCSKPLKIVSFQDNSLHIDVKAINSILDQVGDRKLSIYSINGPLRSGKSFMLNFFAKYLESNRSEGWIHQETGINFAISGKAERETIGIQIYPKAFFVKKNGEEIAILLIDTQGLFDQKTSIKENTILFAISSLLSSFLIFNAKEQISEDMIDHFRTFSGYARMANENNNNVQSFQKLLFLIRDFNFDYPFGYYSDSQSINGKNYKKDHLDSNPEAASEVQIAHEDLMNTYNDVSCYLMPYPGSRIAGKSEINIDLAEDAFKEHIQKFVKLVLSPEAIPLKKVGGKLISGKELKPFVETWMKAFNGSAIPDAKKMFEMTASMQGQKAKKVALEFYISKTQVYETCSQPTEKGLFSLIHQIHLNEAIKLYDDFNKFKVNENEDVHREKLEIEIETRFEYLNNINSNKIAIKENQRRAAEESARQKRLIEENRINMERLRLEEEAETKQLAEMKKRQEEEQERIRAEDARKQEELQKLIMEAVRRRIEAQFPVVHVRRDSDSCIIS